jgi:hypothetical protein
LNVLALEDASTQSGSGSWRTRRLNGRGRWMTTDDRLVQNRDNVAIRTVVADHVRNKRPSSLATFSGSQIRINA